MRDLRLRNAGAISSQGTPALYAIASTQNLPYDPLDYPERNSPRMF